MEEFNNYKEKQQFYRKASKTGIVKYRAKKGGRPYIKEIQEMEDKIKNYKLKRLYGDHVKEVA